jgi:hypothetical protein
MGNWKKVETASFSPKTPMDPKRAILTGGGCGWAKATFV